MTKQDSLFAWIQEKRIVRTHEIIAWGLDNYYNRAIRTARQFSADGLIRRLTDTELFLKNIKTKEAVYTVVDTQGRLF